MVENNNIPISENVDSRESSAQSYARREQDVSCPEKLHAELGAYARFRCIELECDCEEDPDDCSVELASDGKAAAEAANPVDDEERLEYVEDIEDDGYLYMDDFWGPKESDTMWEMFSDDELEDEARYNMEARWELFSRQRSLAHRYTRNNYGQPVFRA